MRNIKKDFPVFSHHKDLVYLDSTSTTQKPAFVIEKIQTYLESSYANIHRGSYHLSEVSEDMYEASKKKVAQFIGAKNWREVVYAQNSTYALNLLASSLGRSNFFQKGDIILLSEVEHHANIVPWLILKEQFDLEIQYIALHDDFSLNMDDLKIKLNEKVKVVSLTHISNVTGEVFDMEAVGEILSSQKVAQPLFIIDASQSVPHMCLDVEKIGCDAIFFTGHKMCADSGIGVLWAKEKLLKNLQPSFCGGGAIASVEKENFIPTSELPARFEPGTPNLSGAISLLAACEYIESMGGYEAIEDIEKKLLEYSLQEFAKRTHIRLIGSTNPDARVGVFSFTVEGVHSNDISDFLAEKNICVRSGQHCAEPFLKGLGIAHSCRMSLYFYNTQEDIEKFFSGLDEAINFLG